MSNATLNPTDLSSMTAPVPAAPVTLADTGIPADRLMQLLLKTLYTGEATGTQASDRMCLPFSVLGPLLEAARTQLLIEVLGTTSASSGAAGYRYALTDLGRDAMTPGSALVNTRCNAVHTFWMRFPIDVAFVDSAGIVKKVVEDLAPWRMAGALFASTVIEFPAGTLKDGVLRVGDRVYLTGEPGRRPLWAA